jgi:hypothetical protein
MGAMQPQIPMKFGFLELLLVLSQVGFVRKQIYDGHRVLVVYMDLWGSSTGRGKEAGFCRR